MFCLFGRLRDTRVRLQDNEENRLPSVRTTKFGGGPYKRVELYRKSSIGIRFKYSFSFWVHVKRKTVTSIFFFFYYDQYARVSLECYVMSVGHLRGDVKWGDLQ